MILDWFCPCGLQGTAVALKQGEELHRVTLSHQHAVRMKHWKDRWRQNVCRGDRLRFDLQNESTGDRK